VRPRLLRERVRPGRGDLYQDAAVRFDRGSPWVALDLYDDDVISVMAVQAADKEYALDTVRTLRRLLAASRERPVDAAASRERPMDAAARLERPDGDAAPAI